METEAGEGTHSTRNSYRRQLRRALPVGIGVSVATVVAGLALLYAYGVRDTHPSIYFRDPLVEAGGRHVGIFTTVGVLLWTASAAVLLHGVMLLRHAPGTHRVARYLLLLGVLTMLMGADDLFFIHEDVGLALAGIAGQEGDADVASALEAPWFLVYAALGAFLAIRFREVMRRTEVLLLGAAVALLGASLAIDIAAHLLPGLIANHDGRLAVADVVEDLLKLSGIQLWLAYTVTTVTAAVLPAVRCRPDVAETPPSA